MVENIRIVQDTFLKMSTQNSRGLHPEDILPASPSEIKIESKELVGNHYRVILPSSTDISLPWGGNVAYIYAAHVEESQIDERLLSIVKKWEGLVLEPYLCAANVWTIGYGRTYGITATTPRITEAQAEEFLKEDLLYFLDGVRELVTVKEEDGYTSAMECAMTSFAFNLGLGALEESTLLRLVNAGRFEDAAGEFERWVWAGGKKLQGLINRREDERKLFLGEA